jgi:transcriptional regulator with XRE-family HTH domain
MRNGNQLGERLRNHRESLGLTQRSLAQKVGVAMSHIAFIEGGRRKPSLKLVGRLADILGIDRQNLLILAHPETKKLITQENRVTQPKVSVSWQRFMENHKLLTRYDVTEREMGVLESLSSLGTVHSSKHFLAILTLIRDIPSVR